MTNANAPARDRVGPRSGITAERYAEFIGQIELTAIWLHDARIQNHSGPETPERAVFAIESDAEWQDQPDGFRVLNHYHVRIEAADTVLADVEVTFGLHFRSGSPMMDEIFTLFHDVNLPVNTWPYLREFVATAVGRMNWQPFTLPTLKRGTRPPDWERQAARTSTAARRKREAKKTPAE